MPKRFERHRRSRDFWDSQPSRSAEVRTEKAADPDPAKRHVRKDTRTWCRGKPGTEHQVEVALHTWGHWENVTCGWREQGKWVIVDTSGRPPLQRGAPVPRNWRWKGVKREWVVTGQVWRCFHEERCTVCGKFLGAVPVCPDYPRM